VRKSGVRAKEVTFSKWSVRGWETRQIDFVLVFPQADVECDIHMEVPVGFDLRGRKKEFCLKLRKNIYGTKQA
jgi:hypothetical protein